MNLANLHTYTMISLLGFGNLLLLALLLAYRGRRARTIALDYFMLARLLHGLGWVFITARGSWPDLITVAAANIVLILGIAAENIAFLSYRDRSLRRERVLMGGAVIGSLVFLVFARTPSLIIAVGALVALTLELPTTAILLKRSRESALVGFVGALLALISAAFIIRMIGGFWGVLDYAVSQALLQSSFFLPVFTVLLAGSPAMILLLKEEDERALRESTEQHNVLFHSTPSTLLLSDPESGMVLDVNPQCKELTGYTPEELIGKTFTELNLWQPGERERTAAAYRAHGRLVDWEIAARNRAGEDRTWITSSGTVQLQGRTLLASSLSDITNRKALESRIQGLLTEKELLLHEVHHRVRNNLNQIVGILQLQKGRDGSGREESSIHTVIDDTVNRVYGMLALYDQVYAGEHYSEVPAHEFLTVLTERLRTAFPNAHAVQLTLDVEEIALPPRTISSLGQLVNELFTNSMKHAFEARDAGNIWLSLRREGAEYVLQHQDDGPGLPQAAAAGAAAAGAASAAEGPPEAETDRNSGSGFGTILIDALAEQLGARWEESGPPGVHYTFHFSAGNEPR